MPTPHEYEQVLADETKLLFKVINNLDMGELLNVRPYLVLALDDVYPIIWPKNS
jgi:hypothetical protein